MMTGSHRLMVVVLAGLMVSTCALTTPARATETAVAAVTFTPIDQPTEAYTSSTCRYDLSGIANRRRVNKLTGCGKLTFNHPVEKRIVPQSWSSWGSPPNTETATPELLYSTSVVNFTIRPTHTVGVEVQRTPGLSGNITVIFGVGPDNVGQITRFVTAEEGALLFAGTVTGTRIREVSVQGGGPFGIANIRVDP